MRLYIFYIALLASFIIKAQNTVGVLSFDAEKTSEGYNLIYPNNQSSVFLLNNCGQIVHEWEDEPTYLPGSIAYLRSDGTLVKCKRGNTPVFDPIWAGGGGEIVEIRSWDNELLWSFEQNDEFARLHHDIAPMPNGNILMISWEVKTEEEVIQAGRNPTSLAQAKLWPDYILEVNPDTDEIVWEWHAWDHLIQDFDPSKDNYGDVADHPELIDINWQTNDGAPDWMHTNSIDYNEDLDQIMLSVPTFHEVWIIDHSTTTEEAAGHFGGQSGRGGDLLYRWGNPMTYRAGTEEDQQLFYQHDLHWIDDFVSEDSPYYGKVALFNNRVTPTYSTVNIIDPIFDTVSQSYSFGEETFLPTDFFLTALHPNTESLFSTTVSSVQVLENDNLLVCSGRRGYSFELTPDNEVVWEYKTPFDGPNPVIQGDESTINNLTFRFKRYPLDYSAFANKDLSSQGFIELNPDDSFCDQLVAIEEVESIAETTIFPNPIDDVLLIKNEGFQNHYVEIRDVLGRTKEAFNMQQEAELETAKWGKGIYLVFIDGELVEKIIKH
jgi:hypothetical protein